LKLSLISVGAGPKGQEPDPTAPTLDAPKRTTEETIDAWRLRRCIHRRPTRAETMPTLHTPKYKAFVTWIQNLLNCPC